MNVFLKTELFEPDRRAVEGVGLDDVGAGLQVGTVDLLDHSRLGRDEHLGAVLQMVRVPGKPSPAHVLFGQLVRIDQRTH